MVSLHTSSICFVRDHGVQGVSEERVRQDTPVACIFISVFVHLQTHVERGSSMDDLSFSLSLSLSSYLAIYKYICAHVL
jgi:hypothetical protein